MYCFRILKYLICAVVLIHFDALLVDAADVVTIEKQAKDYQNQIDQLSEQKTNAQREFQEITQHIATLNQRNDLSYLQRRRLEKYLKQSQQQAARLENIQREIGKYEKLLDTRRHELITRYDQQLRSALSLLNKRNLTSKEKRKTLSQLVRIKYKREAVRAQLNLPLQQENVSHTLHAEDMENRQLVRQHIDWLHDQNDILRADAYELEHIISNLKAEIEIRDKMADFQNDIQLFDPGDEGVMFDPSVVNATSDKSRGAEEVTDSYGPADRLSNAYLQSESTSKSSLVQLLPRLTMQEHAELSNTDIERVIVELDEKRVRLLQQADSLIVRTDELTRVLHQLQKQPQQDD